MVRTFFQTLRTVINTVKYVQFVLLKSVKLISGVLGEKSIFSAFVRTAQEFFTPSSTSFLTLCCGQFLYLVVILFKTCPLI
jgi:hypothetical protein